MASFVAEIKVKDVKDDMLYSMLVYLPKHLVRIGAGDHICGVRNWLNDRCKLSIRDRNDSYVRSNNANRVRGDRV
jgi:hypothetical protein